MLSRDQAAMPVGGVSAQKAKAVGALSDKFAIQLGASPTSVVMAEDLADFFIGRYRFDDIEVFNEDFVPAITFRLIGVKPLIQLDKYMSRPESTYTFGDIDVVVLDNQSVAMGRYSF